MLIELRDHPIFNHTTYHLITIPIFNHVFQKCQIIDRSLQCHTEFQPCPLNHISNSSNSASALTSQLHLLISVLLKAENFKLLIKMILVQFSIPMNVYMYIGLFLQKVVILQKLVERDRWKSFRLPPRAFIKTIKIFVAALSII